MVQDSKTVKDTRNIGKKYILRTYGLSAEGAKAGSKKRKRSTILPFSIVQSFFCILILSLCSNHSLWPGRQIVPDGSQCYIHIFDGLVNFLHAIHGKTAARNVMKMIMMMRMVMIVMVMMRMVMMVMIRLIERRGRSAPQEAAPILLPTVNNQPQIMMKYKFLTRFHLSSSYCLQHR